MGELAALLLLPAVGLGVASHMRARGACLRFQLTFPRAADAAQLTAALRAIQGLLPPWWRRLTSRPTVAIEVVATRQGIGHFLVVPDAATAYVLGAFRAAIPGLHVDRAERAPARRIRRKSRPSGNPAP